MTANILSKDIIKEQVSQDETQKSATEINTPLKNDCNTTAVKPKTTQKPTNASNTAVATTTQGNCNETNNTIAIETLEDFSNSIKRELEKLPIKKTATFILKELIGSIEKVDFEILAFPDIEKTREDIEKLKPFTHKEDGSLSKEHPKEFEEYKILSKKINSCKLTNNHYLVLCVEQVLEVAKTNNWGLCKNGIFIYLYSSSHWIVIEKDLLQNFLGKTALKMGVEKFKAKIHTFKEDLFKQFLTEAYLPKPEVKQENVLINLLNGTYEITASKRVLRPFDKSDFLTHQLQFNYNPKATAPIWQKFINEVLPDKDKQKVFAEFLGYIFIKPSVLKLEKMLILFGTGANGKSVCFEVINALLGTENVSNYSLQSLTDKNGYYRAKIANKLVNYASEINGKLETDVFKQMASGEPIEARLPYGEPMNVTDYAKLIFNCNELPREVEHTNAYFRRFLIINFDVTIPENKQDKQLSKKIIQSELSGVFNWILEGLDRILDQKNFSKCEAIENARSDYEKQSDSVQLFISENGYKICSNKYILMSELYPTYRTFCIEDGFKPVNKSNFSKRLTASKIFVAKINAGNVAYLTL